VKETDHGQTRLLRARRERPRSRATKKCDEFPPLHGFPRAEGYAGQVKEYHILGRGPQSDVRLKPLLQVLTNFRQQLAWAKRFRHIVITARRSGLLFFPIERIRRASNLIFLRVAARDRD
jgi:hypothetical protein